MSNERIPMLIKELGGKLGLADLELDDENVCVIGTDEGLDAVVNYVDDDEMLIVYCMLATLPKGCEERLYPELLKANFGWPQTRGTTLSVANSQVVMQKYIACEDLEADQAFEEFEHFLQRGTFLAAAIREQIDGPSAPADSTDDHIDPSMLV